MKAFFHSILTAALLFAVPAAVADELPDSVRQRPVYPIEEVVVTGTRNETDVRLLPMTVSVVDRAAIERSGRQSLLPILTEQVPGLFATARGIMGYGVSTGAADGMSLRGIKQNVARMPAIGAPVHSRLVAVYTLGAAYAGVAGALLTQTTQFVSLDVLAFTRSAEIMLMLVLGGTGCLYGALIGTMVFMTAHHFLSDLNPQYWQFWLGAVLVLIVLFARDGIMGVAQRLQARLARRATP